MAVEEAKEAAEKDARPDSLAQYVECGAWRQDVERAATGRTPTGFPALDSWLGGGLYEGLLVLAGSPSLGKTSFMWQIAESAAVGGFDCLFFSMEMSRKELLSKSLARRAFENGKDVSADDVQSGRDGCSVELQDFLNETGGRLSVIQAGFGYGLRALWEYVQRYQRRNSDGRLLVVVDYLQAVVGRGAASEITAIADTAKGLRQLAREFHCPVVCASSTARTGYAETASFSAYYGSGMIEYSSDVAAVLQYAIIGSDQWPTNKNEQNRLIEREKAKNPRQISFVGLKNRRGEASCKVDFQFDARHCRCVEAQKSAVKGLTREDMFLDDDEIDVPY